MIAAELWPYVVILFAGWFATDFWRWLGVLAGNRLSEGSEALNWVRAVATALVMAVTAKLIVFPTGQSGRFAALAQARGRRSRLCRLPRERAACHRRRRRFARPSVARARTPLRAPAG